MNTDKNEPKVCPLCGRTYTEVPALSRKDNTMLIIVENTGFIDLL